MKFLKWVDKHFPEEDGVPTAQSRGSLAFRACFFFDSGLQWVLLPARCYCKAMDLQEEGVVALRPWMLTYDSKLGMRGMAEPD